MRSHRPLLGIAFTCSAMLLFPFLDAVAKYLGQLGVPVIEIVWARMTIGALLIAPLLWKSEGMQSLVPVENKLNFGRAVFIFLSTLCFFGALKFQGIAETLAIYFIQPLIITTLAPYVLNENVDLKRWVAVIVGFIGVLIIIRPGFQSLNPGVFLALASGFFSAVSLLLSRRIAGRGSALANTFYSTVFGAILATIWVVFFWQTPTMHQVMMFVLLAAIGTLGNYLTLKAHTYAEASLLAPFGYTEMINAVLAGWYFFGDFPDNYTFLGVGVLIVSAIYISLHERKTPPA